MYDDYDLISDIDIPGDGKKPAEAVKPEAKLTLAELEELAPAVPAAIENLDGTEIDVEAEKQEKEKYAQKYYQPEEKNTVFDGEPEAARNADPYNTYGDVDEGRQKVKIIAIIVSVTAAIAFGVSLFKGRGVDAFAAVMRAFFALMMTKGHNWAKWLILIALAANIYSDLVLAFADLGSGDAALALYLFMFIVHTAIAVMLLADRQIRAFFGKW